MATHKVIVSETARKQLGSCLLFIAQDDAAAAERLRRRLIDAIRRLEALPARYPFFNEPYLPANKYHKMFVENRHLVLYQIRDEVVFVDYVVDCRRDYRWLIR